MNTQKTTTNTVYHHIDNGGITLEMGFELCTDDSGWKTHIPFLAFDTQYFGYPSIVARLQGIEMNADYFQKIGLEILKFSETLRSLEKDLHNQN